MHIKYFLLSSLVGSAGLFISTTASAEDFVTPGVSFSVKLCCGPGGGAVGFGPALNYAHWVETTSGSLVTVGAFAFLHYYPALDALRIGAGPQASYYFGGVEAGPSAFFQKGESTTAQVSLTPFGSIGFVWTGIRLNFGAAETNPFAEFVFGAGYPVGVGPGSSGLIGFDTGSGRPIRVRGERRTSGTRADDDYGMKLRPTMPRSRRARRALAKAWQREAELEYSSISAFEHLAGQLEALGAPDALVRRCLTAARDEAKHARMCYGLASAYGGKRRGPRPLDLRDLDPQPTLARVVFETVIDGCLGEAIAAAAARKRLSRESDPVVRKILRAIVRDEAAHARLAWSIATWALEKNALVLALERIEQGRAEDDTTVRVQRRVVKRLRWMIASLPDRKAA